MQSIRSVAATAIVALALAAPAYAVTADNFPPKTTRDLLALCSASANDPLAAAAINFCHGFAQGAVAVQIENDAAERISQHLFCLPSPRPAFQQAVQMFNAWAAAHPANLDGPPADGFFQFLRDTYPCPTGR
ncbi:MAG: hypothetical protein J0I21_19795 [Alphaproteobacteria bacterium]|nr:hypothetical protein [Alphaproteobacteria bacterium]